MKDPKTRKWISMGEARERGLIIPPVSAKPKAGPSPKATTEKTIYDPATGMVTDPDTGKKLTLAQAVEAGEVGSHPVHASQWSGGDSGNTETH